MRAYGYITEGILFKDDDTPYDLIISECSLLRDRSPPKKPRIFHSLLMYIIRKGRFNSRNKYFPKEKFGISVKTESFQSLDYNKIVTYIINGNTTIRRYIFIKQFRINIVKTKSQSIIKRVSTIFQNEIP